MYKISDFKLEKGSSFPDYDDCLFYVMRDTYDFPEPIIQRVNKLINHYIEEFEQKKHLVLSECELSVWLDISKDKGKHGKDMYLHFLILDDKRGIEINGKEQIKANDNLYSECRDIFMYRLEEFLFQTKER